MHGPEINKNNFVIGKKENFHKIIPVFHLEKKKGAAWKFVKRRELEKKNCYKIIIHS